MAHIVRENNFIHLTARILIFHKIIKWIAVCKETACFVRILVPPWLFGILLTLTAKKLPRNSLHYDPINFITEHYKV